MVFILVQFPDITQKEEDVGKHWVSSNKAHQMERDGEENRLPLQKIE